MQGLTPAGQRIVEDAAKRHNVSSDAAYILLMALAAGGGRQAQFNHPDLGGMGQWSQGGMIMVGDMFNNELKHRVDALCNELAAVLEDASAFPPAPISSQSQSQSSSSSGASLFVPGRSGSRWPAELGAPASAGSQNDLHYAVFPAVRRLAIEQAGRITIYDTGDHRISGFSQQQSGDQSLTFTSQNGLVSISDLKVVPPVGESAPESSGQSASSGHPIFASAPPPVSPVPQSAPPAVQLAGSVSGGSDEEIFSRLERLADLRKKDVITVEEFQAKKAELLARL